MPSQRRCDRVRVTFTLIVTISITLAFISMATAADVAYIYRKNFRIDHNIIDVFSDLGLSTDLIDERNIPANLSTYRLLFVGDESFIRPNRIPVHTMPTIVANYYHGELWGLTDQEGVSSLASTSPLTVYQNGSFIPVYTSAFKRNRIAIQYYYLDRENIASSLIPIASTETTSSGHNFGHVIVYGKAGSSLYNGKVLQKNLCFFGIIESDYWTPQARSLFENCINFVAGGCRSNDACPANQTSQPYCKDGDVYRNQTAYACVNPATVQAVCVGATTPVKVQDCPFGCENGACKPGIHDVALTTVSPLGKVRIQDKNAQIISSPVLICNESYHLTIEVENRGNHTENVIISGIVGTDFLTFNDSAFTLAPADARMRSAAFHLNNSERNISIEINVFPSDDNPANNHASLDIAAVCLPIACHTNADCGTDGFISPPVCSMNNVTRQFQSHRCVNPATPQSSCSSTITNTTLQVCPFLCANGQCQTPRCSSAADCSDNNPLTFDECVNPNTTVSQCRNTPLNCASSNDCGASGFIGNEFCSSNAIAKNYQNATCVNPATLNSFCTLQVESREIELCMYACTQGACIRCDENADCGDNNAATRDMCVNPGTRESYCNNEPQHPVIVCGDGIRQGNESCDDGNTISGDGCSSLCTVENITCRTNADCGTDGFITPPFCTARNITRTFQSYICLNAGTSNSSCIQLQHNQTIQTCSDACTNGMCGTIVCRNNSECADTNPKTFDECVNPATPISECRNTPINCASNADCGFSGFLGNEFCALSNVAKNYQNATCLNAGTLQSSCRVVINPIQVASCAFACTQGACIRCDENADCSDNNAATRDMCVNPATLESYCSNQRL